MGVWVRETVRDGKREREKHEKHEKHELARVRDKDTKEDCSLLPPPPRLSRT